MSSTKLPEMPSRSLAGKKALVTGASSGIGMAAAVALVHAGASACLAARNAAALEELAAELRNRGGSAQAVPIDVTDVDAVRSMVADAGPFDILVNNAGTNRPVLAVDVTEEDFDAIMDLNVKASYFVAAACARSLIAAGSPGSFINISSQMGHVSGIKRSLYSASKFAVEGFTRGMALEWGPYGIRVNALAPTFIRTPMTEQVLADREFMDRVVGNIALGRLGTVEDLMGAIVFLASDESSLFTGTSLLADGGWTAA